MSSNRSVDRATRVGDPFAHAGEARTKAQKELMQAAENVLAFLDDRRDHQPPRDARRPRGPPPQGAQGDDPPGASRRRPGGGGGVGR